MHRIATAAGLALGDGGLRRLQLRLHVVASRALWAEVAARGALSPWAESKRMQLAAASLEAFLLRVFGEEIRDNLVRRIRQHERNAPALRSSHGTRFAALLGSLLEEEEHVDPSRSDLASGLERIEDGFETVAQLYALAARMAKRLDEMKTTHRRRRRPDEARRWLVHALGSLYQRVSGKPCGEGPRGPGPRFIATAYQEITGRRLPAATLTRDLRARRRGTPAREPKRLRA